LYNTIISQKEASRLRRPDSIILIAIWEFITAFLAFIGLLAVGFFALATVVAEVDRVAAGFGLSIAVILLIAFIAMSVAGGIGLLTGKEWGRTIGIIHAVLSLFSIPVGTVIGVLILVYLSRSDVRDYFNPPLKM
jgi:hypothetical protein